MPVLTADRRRSCPTCERPLPATGAVGPFCSERCRLIDLGAWLTDGARAIPGDAPAAELEDPVDPPAR